MRPYKIDLWGAATDKWIDLDHVLGMTLTTTPPWNASMDSNAKAWCCDARISIVFMFRDQPVVYVLDHGETDKEAAELAMAKFIGTFEALRDAWADKASRAHRVLNALPGSAV